MKKILSNAFNMAMARKAKNDKEINFDKDCKYKLARKLKNKIWDKRKRKL